MPNSVKSPSIPSAVIRALFSMLSDDTFFSEFLLTPIILVEGPLRELNLVFIMQANAFNFCNTLACGKCEYVEVKGELTDISWAVNLSSRIKR